MIFQKEVGACTGRGFSNTDTNGWCAKFKTWITKTGPQGGPNWFIIDDQSSLVPLTAVYTNVNTTTNEITITGHGLCTGRTVYYEQGTSGIGGLSNATLYYAIVVDANTIKLATSEVNSWNGTAIDITSQGTGTHTFTPRDPFIVVSNVENPVLNAYNEIGGLPAKFMKVGFNTAESGYVRVYHFLWWDKTNKVGRGFTGDWRKLNTLDSSEFAYDFRGGPEQMILQTRTGASRYCVGVDEFVGDSDLTEPTTVVGTLQSGVTAGSSVVLTLGIGEAANFTQNNYYFIYDFNGHSWVNYSKCTGVNVGANQITLESVNKNFPAGAVVCSYAHRFVSFGSTVSEPSSGYGYRNPILPYVSATDNNYVCSVDGGGFGITSAQYLSEPISKGAPMDNGGKVCVARPTLTEYVRKNDNFTTGMNRTYGQFKNIYVSSSSGLGIGDGRVITGKNYVYHYSTGAIGFYNSSEAALFQDTTSEV
jgi:hypothetical protein